ncbi:hypothetical protein ABVN80_19265 [Acinetobacter baumannii]
MGRYPIIFRATTYFVLWMVGHQCAGVMSIREDCYDIIGNDAHLQHIILSSNKRIEI